MFHCNTEIWTEVRFFSLHFPPPLFLLFDKIARNFYTRDNPVLSHLLPVACWKALYLNLHCLKNLFLISKGLCKCLKWPWFKILKKKKRKKERTWNVIFSHWMSSDQIWLSQNDWDDFHIKKEKKKWKKKKWESNQVFYIFLVIDHTLQSKICESIPSCLN